MQKCVNKICFRSEVNLSVMSYVLCCGVSAFASPESHFCYRQPRSIATENSHTRQRKRGVRTLSKLAAFTRFTPHLLICNQSPKALTNTFRKMPLQENKYLLLNTRAISSPRWPASSLLWRSSPAESSFECSLLLRVLSANQEEASSLRITSRFVVCKKIATIAMAKTCSSST